MMSPFETFEHTADIGIEARGASLAELFASAAEGMLSLLISPGAAQAREDRPLTVSADDLAGLLVNWLNELLVLLNADGFVPVRFDVQDVTERSLRAQVGGEPVDPARHRFHLDIKAATYHQLSVRKNAEWRARVILDV